LNLRVLQIESRLSAVLAERIQRTARVPNGDDAFESKLMRSSGCPNNYVGKVVSWRRIRLNVIARQKAR
jgi:hypothetical protein